MKENKIIPIRIVKSYTGEQIDEDLIFQMYKELQEYYNKVE